VFAQEQHEQDEQKAKPAQQEDKKAQPAAKPAAKPSAQQEKKPAANNAKQQQNKNAKPAAKNAQQAQRAGGNGGGRIPDDKFKANFGQQHSFRVTQSDYSNHRFQYGGYSFGFVDPWPSNWLYTQNVYVIE